MKKINGRRSLRNRRRRRKKVPQGTRVQELRSKAVILVISPNVIVNTQPEYRKNIGFQKLSQISFEPSNFKNRPSTIIFVVPAECEQTFRRIENDKM